MLEINKKRSVKILKRIFSALLVVLGVTFLTFLLSYLSPDDAAVVKLSAMKTGYTEESLEKMREAMGLNRPFIVQYLDWLNGVIHADFGSSFRTNHNVTEMILSALPKTLSLTVMSLCITLIISVPLGIACAVKPNGIIDRIMVFFSYFFSSIPSFFISLLMLYFFCIKLDLFSIRAEEGIRGLIMPSLVMGVTLSSWYTRQIKTIALEQLTMDYVKSLKAKGVSKSRILGKHVLKNCMVPIISLLGVSFGSTLGGSAIVESIFTLGGVGSLAIESVTMRDYPVIQGYAAFMAGLYLIVNFLVDVISKRIDPRISKN